MRTHAILAIGLAALIGLSQAYPAHAQTETQQVSFPAGSDGTTIAGAITGEETVRYVLGASAGQRMTVEMTTSNASAYFNITAPGATEALHIGSVGGNRFDGVLPAGGNYAVEVYLMRNAARRGETAEFTISFRITGAGADGEVQPDFADGLMGGPDFWAVTGLAAGDRLNLRAGPSTGDRVIGQLAEGEIVRNLGCRMTGKQRWCQVETQVGAGWVSGRYLRESGAPGIDDSLPEPPLPITVPGQPKGNGEPFTATGTIPCARNPGQPMGSCTFGVIRTGKGGASLWVAFPDGSERYILFEGGAPVFTDADAAIAADLDDDLFSIRIGVERFEVPMAAVNGG
jgi:hypothetical protein